MTGFPCYRDGQIVGLDMRCEGENRFAPGSKKAESFWSSTYNESQNNIVLSESPIDLISYHQIKGKENNFYLSSNGTLTMWQIDTIVSLLHKGQLKTITAATDNDLSGYKFDTALLAALTGNDKLRVLINKKDYVKLGVSLQGAKEREYEITTPEEYHKLLNKIIKSYQLEETFIFDKAPGKDWNQEINPNEKKSRSTNP